MTDKIQAILTLEESIRTDYICDQWNSVTIRAKKIELGKLLFSLSEEELEELEELKKDK